MSQKIRRYDCVTTSEEKKRNFMNNYVKDGQLINLDQLNVDYCDINLIKMVKDMGISIVPFAGIMDALDIYNEIVDPQQEQELLDNYSKEVIAAFIHHMEYKHAQLDDPLISIVLPYMNNEEICKVFLNFGSFMRDDITICDVVDLFQKYPKIHDALMKYNYA